jgi:nitrite reductase (NADH) large subunit
MPSMIIIGDGIAAINAVKAIREINRDVTIDLFGEERFYPYYRLKLSKNLLNRVNEDDILLQRKDWYESNRVNLHLNVRVQGVDVARQEVILPQGKRMRYDKLLLANGASNRPLAIAGAANGKAHTIRNLEDVKHLQAAMAGKKAIFYIGGGVLGLETAWGLHQYHKQVTIAEIQNRLFPHQLDERAATFLKNLVESFGISVLTNTEIVKIIGDQAVEAVETKEGLRFPCDMILYSTGIRPNINMLKETPLRTNRGVIVDAQMRTNVAHVYAAGDVAEYNGKVYGLWSIAAGQGKTAGYNMADQATLYQPIVPATMLNAFGTALFSIGDVSESSATRTVIEEDRMRNTYRRVFIRDHVVIGAIVIGDNRKSLLLKNAIEQKIPLGAIDWNGVTIDAILERLTRIH